MSTPERGFLLHRLDETRQEIEELLPKIDPAKFIYPGWTIKEMLAHMTGWDDVLIDSLRAHLTGNPPALEAIRSINEYNDRTVAARAGLDYDHILKEWRLARQVLRTILEQMPDEKFSEPLPVPWGKPTSVAFLVEVFRDHEEEHARDIRRWLENPDRPIEENGG